MDEREKGRACVEDRQNVETEDMGTREEVPYPMLCDPKWPVHKEKNIKKSFQQFNC